MARYQSRLQHFKSPHVAANFGISTPHYLIHRALSDHFTSKAKVDPNNQAFQDALLFFTRAEAEKGVESTEGKLGTTKAYLHLHCAKRSLLHPNYDFWLTICASPLDSKEVQDEAAAEEARYKLITGGKWMVHGKKNADDISEGLKSDMGFVLNAAEHLDVILRQLGAKPIGTHTAHQNKQTFAADARTEEGHAEDTGTTSVLRKDYLFNNHLVTFTTNATVHK